MSAISAWVAGARSGGEAGEGGSKERAPGCRDGPASVYAGGGAVLLGILRVLVELRDGKIQVLTGQGRV